MRIALNMAWAFLLGMIANVVFGFSVLNDWKAWAFIGVNIASMVIAELNAEKGQS